MPDRLPKAQAGRDSGGWALHHKGCVSILVVACLMDQVLAAIILFWVENTRRGARTETAAPWWCSGLFEEKRSSRKA